MEAVGRDLPRLPAVAAREELHAADKTGGEQQSGIVDMHLAILIEEMLLVEVGELVVLDVAVAVGFLGEAALDGGAKERVGVLHGFEEGTLPQLRLRLTVVDLRRTAAAEGLPEAGVVDAVADDARFRFTCITLCL